MPDGRYPGAEWMPGVNAGYRAGRTPVRSVVCHYTVGRNSTAIMLKGYYQFQANRDGTIYQAAEADAVCWHAGSPWNGYGPGIECEHLPGFDDELWTPPQYDAIARLCQWLHDEWGVPLDFYDGPRTNSHAGFITHRSLIQTGDAHSDWWPELPRVTTPEPPHQEAPLMGTFIQVPGDPVVWFFIAGARRAVPTVDYINLCQYLGQSRNGASDVVTVSKAQLDLIPVAG